MKLQRLSNIICAVNELIYSNSTNIRSVSDYSNKEYLITNINSKLFTAVDDYKTLLTDFGELK